MMMGKSTVRKTVLVTIFSITVLIGHNYYQMHQLGITSFTNYDDDNLPLEYLQASSARAENANEKLESGSTSIFSNQNEEQQKHFPIDDFREIEVEAKGIGAEDRVENEKVLEDAATVEEEKGLKHNRTNTNTSSASLMNKNLTISEMIRIENNNAFNSDEKIFSHYFAHIPKTGGGYAFWILGRLVKFTEDEHRALNLPNRQRPCNEATRPLKFFHSHFRHEFRGVQCNMWMSERPIELSDDSRHRHPTYNHAYTIVRNPREHVVSQYFHCKESKDHRKFANLMPSTFDEWLDYHVNRYDVAIKTNTTHTFTERRSHDFKCYDPIDHQSYFVKFNKTVNESDLKERFDVLGDMNMLEKSICVIHIRYSGNIPPMCDCTGKEMKEEDHHHRRRRLHDHGVRHHGATFDLSEEQEAKIAKITQNDVILYERAQRVFQQNVKDIEDELGIRLCDRPDILAGL